MWLVFCVLSASVAMRVLRCECYDATGAKREDDQIARFGIRPSTSTKLPSGINHDCHKRRSDLGDSGKPQRHECSPHAGSTRKSKRAKHDNMRHSLNHIVTRNHPSPAYVVRDLDIHKHGSPQPQPYISYSFNVDLRYQHKRSWWRYMHDKAKCVLDSGVRIGTGLSTYQNWSNHDLNNLWQPYENCACRILTPKFVYGFRYRNGQSRGHMHL
jgi:hypothetical protein